MSFTVLGDVLPAAGSLDAATWDRMLPEGTSSPPEELPASVLVAEWTASGRLVAPITAELAVALIDDPLLREVPFLQLLPDLARSATPIADAVGIRTELAHRLTEAAITRWHQLESTPGSVQEDWGRSDAELLTAAALREAADEGIRLEPRASTHSAVPYASAVNTIANWAVGERGIGHLGAAIEAATEDPHAPTEVRRALAQLHATDLQPLLTEDARLYDLRSALQRLLSTTGNREIILKERVLAGNEKQTLDELGRKLGVTRERIRQIEKQLIKGLDELLADPEFAVVNRAVGRLRDEIGDCRRLSDLPEIAAWSTNRAPAPSDDELLRARFLYQRAGPWLEHEHWLLHGSRSDLPSATSAALDGILADGPVSEDEAKEAMVELGVPADDASDWLQDVCDCRVIEGQVVRWRGSMSDKAEAILEVRGEPLTPDEFVDVLGAETNVRSMLNQIQSDDRFMRRGLKLYGLRRWGGEEYTTIKEEIEQEIERQGGAASLEYLIEVLCSQFGVSESSVRAYAADAPFVRTSGGLITVGEGTPRYEQRAIEDCRGCFRLGTHWAWRVVVDSEVLRGSGRQLPSGVLQSVGMKPGDVRQMTTPVGDVMFRYGRQATVGSLRRAANDLGCEEGDRLFVVLETNDSLSFVAVRQQEVAKRSGIERLASEVGVTGSDDPVKAVAQALGLPPDEYRPDAIRRRLRARKEDELMALVPATSETSDHGLLDELIGLGE